jgi:site-specific DNA-methyltransferase (adenine-specific)
MGKLSANDGVMSVSIVFDQGGVVLYHADCLDVLPQLERESAHLLLTDPPYGQEYQSNKRQQPLAMIQGDDGSLDLSELLTAACRVLRRGRHAYVFGPFPAEGTPLTAAVPLIWDKKVNGTGNLSLPWSKSHENITFCVYEPSGANRAKGYGNLAARMRRGSVVQCPRPQGAATGRHPNEKPVLLLRQLIESSSVMGETVLDPFAGSGSTLVAAMREGRRAVGIEVDGAYCATAVRRLAAEAAAEGT